MWFSGVRTPTLAENLRSHAYGFLFPAHKCVSAQTAIDTHAYTCGFRKQSCLAWTGELKCEGKTSFQLKPCQLSIAELFALLSGTTFVLAPKCVSLRKWRILAEQDFRRNRQIWYGLVFCGKHKNLSEDNWSGLAFWAYFSVVVRWVFYRKTCFFNKIRC